MKIKRYAFFIFMFCIGLVNGQLQRYNHPELEWYTIETEHFYIHFHQGTERTASIVAKIGEDIYQPVTQLYHYIPDGKIHFVIRDHDDESNGAAFYYDNKVEIWAPPMNFLLRGTHNWLRNVVTHEFTHMISLGAIRKMPRQLPAIYLQWIGYEEEKRPDVIHGYPNTLVSFPLVGTVIPLWLAEGMAQFQREDLRYDIWDTHRDMILRTAVLHNQLASIAEMGIGGKDHLGYERDIYNQGYAFVLYLVDRYGEEVLTRVSRSLKSPLRIQFSSACQSVIGKSEQELYNEWKDWLTTTYDQRIKNVQEHLHQGDIIEAKGLANFFPVCSPDGMSIAYVSNRGGDYISQSNIWLYDIKTTKQRMITKGVVSSISWSSDGKKLLYAKKEARTRQGSHYYDLYTYDLKTKKEKRLTKYLRARQPDWSRDDQIVCVIESDGTSNLVVLRSDGSGIKPITSFQHGEQIFTPRWMNNGNIVFDLAEEEHGRDIAMIDSLGLHFRYLIKTQHDERDPFPHPDGKSIYYSSDTSGIFNIYRYNLASKEMHQLTNVVGGAFMPSVTLNGKLVYSHFQTDGYKIGYLDSLHTIDPAVAVYASPYQAKREKNQVWDIAQYDDRNSPRYDSQPYKPIFSKLSFLPRIMMDYPGKVKVGTYFYGSDFLDKVLLFGGFALNSQFDTDAFGIFEYKRFYPTLFIELYHIMRNKSFVDPDADYDIRYNLMEVDVGADWNINDANTLRTAFVHSQYGYLGKGTFMGLYQKFSSTYHKGNVIQLQWTHKSIGRSKFSHISPLGGRIIEVKAERAWQNYAVDFEINMEYGTLVDVYERYNYDQFELDWREYLSLPWLDHALSLRLKAGLIDQPVESFYYLFGGGLDGLKGYPYYSIEGRKLAQFGLAYRFPIWRKMGLRFLFFNFDNLYVSVYGEAGNGWNRNKIDFSDWKRDVGVQLRLSLFNFYAYPMCLFVDAAYGLDRFVHENQIYGKTWRMYFGLLFDFLD